MHKKKLRDLCLGICLLLGLNACGYVKPLTDLGKADDYRQSGDHKKAAFYYEKAINGFARSGALQLQCDARFKYAFMLMESAPHARPNYARVARRHYAWVNERIDRQECPVVSKAQTTYWLARTYFAEATDSYNEQSLYEFHLKKAYRLLQTARSEFIREQSWLNLSYVYFAMAEAAQWYGDLPAAVEAIEKAVRIGEKHGFKDELEQDIRFMQLLKAELDEARRREQESLDWPSIYEGA